MVLPQANTYNTNISIFEQQIYKCTTMHTIQGLLAKTHYVSIILIAQASSLKRDQRMVLPQDLPTTQLFHF